MKTIYISALFLVMLFLTVSCTDDATGIFMSISQETASGDGTAAFENSSPGFLARLGTTTYTNSGPLYAKPDSTKTWTLVTTLTASLSQTVAPFAVSGAVSGTTLYVLFVSADAASSGTCLGVWGTSDGTTWTEVIDTAVPATETLRGLFVANDQLFAWSSGVSTASLLYLDPANTLLSSGLGVTSATCEGFRGAAWDGTNYWFPAGSKVFTGTAAGAIAEETGVPAGASLTGCVYTLETGLLFSSSNGCIYQKSGATWTPTAVLSYKTDFPYAFSSLFMAQYGTENEKTLLAGTKSLQYNTKSIAAKGYLEFAVTGTFAIATLAPNSAYNLITPGSVNFETTLATVSVMGFASVGTDTGQTLFALTYGDGLWSNAYADTTGEWSGWIRE